MPFAATGGLGDVLGSLPVAIREASKGDVDVRVVMPLYSAVSKEWRDQMEQVAEYELPLAWRRQYCGVRSLVKDGVTYYFIDNQYYFNRQTLYGNYDDAERFAFFCKAAIDMLGVIGFYPDVIHAHDWQAALSLVYLDRKYRQIQGYEFIKTVFTIHNIEYQGKYDKYILGDVFGLDTDMLETMEYDGCLNLMKAAIVSADRVSTVSPTYAKEITTPEYAHGLDPVLRDNAHKLCGILNGIDIKSYNPWTDDAIVKKYSAGRKAGKKADKLALLKEFGLPEEENVPLIGMVTRLVSHKGIDLVRQTLEAIVPHARVVVLGSGDEEYERFFTGAAGPQVIRLLPSLTISLETAKRFIDAWKKLTL
jgi:starch synthase